MDSRNSVASTFLLTLMSKVVVENMKNKSPYIC